MNFIKRTEENLAISIDVAALLSMSDLQDYMRPDVAEKSDLLAKKLTELMGGPADYDVNDIILALCKKYGIE